MDNSIVVRLPTIDEIARRWVDLEPMLLRATKLTRCFEPIDILLLTTRAQMAIWFIEKGTELLATMVTEIKTYPRRRILECAFVAGRGVKEWRDIVIKSLEDYGRKAGCTAIVGTGRKGWDRFGFEYGGAIWVRGIKDT